MGGRSAEHSATVGCKATSVAERTCRISPVGGRSAAVHLPTTLSVELTRRISAVVAEGESLLPASGMHRSAADSTALLASIASTQDFVSLALRRDAGWHLESLLPALGMHLYTAGSTALLASLASTQDFVSLALRRGAGWHLAAALSAVALLGWPRHQSMTIMTTTDTIIPTIVSVQSSSWRVPSPNALAPLTTHVNVVAFAIFAAAPPFHATTFLVLSPWVVVSLPFTGFLLFSSGQTENV